ncbi:hypothetical protein NQD34_009221 [Periophthalmus magnuspinnatus]|nr:hypothetical protein NQD34_009221 [Periophthalmus magnuspinnatus]
MFKVQKDNQTLLRPKSEQRKREKASKVRDKQEEEKQHLLQSASTYNMETTELKAQKRRHKRAPSPRPDVFNATGEQQRPKEEERDTNCKRQVQRKEEQKREEQKREEQQSKLRLQKEQRERERRLLETERQKAEQRRQMHRQNVKFNSSMADHKCLLQKRQKMQEELAREAKRREHTSYEEQVEWEVQRALANQRTVISLQEHHLQNEQWERERRLLETERQKSKQRETEKASKVKAERPERKQQQVPSLYTPRPPPAAPQRTRAPQKLLRRASMSSPFPVKPTEPTNRCVLTNTSKVTQEKIKIPQIGPKKGGELIILNESSNTKQRPRALQLPQILPDQRWRRTQAPVKQASVQI